jgi:hypothetical protein
MLNCIHSGNDNMNSAHPLLGELDIVRVKQPKGKQNQNGWYDFPYNFDPVWMEEDCKYHTLNPLKFKTWKLQEKTFHG